MQWTNDWAEFFAMGKHGDYVWASYGITFLALVGMVFIIRFGMKSMRKELAQRLKQNDGTEPKAASKLSINKHN